MSAAEPLANAVDIDPDQVPECLTQVLFYPVNYIR